MTLGNFVNGSINNSGGDMKRPGRPRREKEQSDSEFGEMLKTDLQRVKGFTQAVLSEETGIAEKTISEMVKGKRTGGPALRRDLRIIIKVLYSKQALFTLDEANALMKTIPAVSALDERDPEDAAIIALFDPPVTQDDPVVADTLPEPEQVPLPETPLPEAPLPAPEVPVRSGRENNRHLWGSISSFVVSLLVIATSALAVSQLISSQQPGTCSSNGVTLYTDINDQGQCHTFGPGEYQLARFGLDQKVSSIKNPRDAYHIRLFDKAKNFYNIDKDTPVLPAEWDKRADEIHIEKHRPTSCTPGKDGIIAFINTDYSGGCLFITSDISDLRPLNFDSDIVSLQFVGSYQDTRQLVLYKQPNYKDECGTYWQNQSDLLKCARIAQSIRVHPFLPPTPIPTVAGTQYAGNVAPLATLSGNAVAVRDGNIQTEWIGGHMVGLELHWAFPVTIHRVVVWDRKQSATDNNQINKLKLVFSDGTATGDIDMVSQGPRCADITLPEKAITALHIIPVDASGNNGLSEVEVWATTGPQYSKNTCVNKVTLSHIIPLPKS
ncbi:MAG: hypothetical protein NVSMB27_48910 [Ktedonobacteraceae bacterium]